ncbi:tail assembly protein [Pandoraea commovens]|uniref:Tail assembly protein n=1 Tax=Pandoraea commovens TaxID=2508289 RepID=A0ABY5QHN0_9BURK|nr:tail assembly protein [Pandoraea commovens]UVA79405.1 tail assembly protein [Pandoraea commovens]
MTEKIRTVRLYGTLGAKYGRVHRFAISSPSEAFRALASQCKGFYEDLAGSRARGIGYAVLVGKRHLSCDELDMPPGADDIRIAPVVLGAKRGGLFQVLLGAAIVSAAWFLGPSGGLVGTFTAGGATQAAAMFGAAMFLGGITQLLSPQQAGLSVKDGPDNGANYNFNGPVNTQAQGNPVPIGYGRMLVGGAVISAGIYAEDQA